MRYFLKEIPENPLRLSNGVPLRFRVLETDDDALVRELLAAIARGIGGVSEIDAETYAVEVKKKQTPRQLGRMAIGSGWTPPNANPAASAVAVAADRQKIVPAKSLPRPDPLEVPTFKPVEGRL